MIARAGVHPSSETPLVDLQPGIARMNEPVFDLNDILHEPSDEQLAFLMESVAAKVRQRAQAARAQLMARLQEEMDALQEHRQLA